MSEHTQLKHKPANASGTSFLPSSGDTAFAPPTSTSLSRESGTALQTAPDRPSSVQETTPDQETTDLQAQLESQYSLAYDFGSMAIARPTGPSVANSAEEPPRSNGTHPTIQRKGLSSSRSSVAVHAPVQGHDLSRISIQPKLTIGQPNDSYEQEADRVAEQVMRMPEPGNSGSAASAGFIGHDFSQVALQPGLQPIVQRKCAASEAEEAEEKLMRKENGESIGDVSSLQSKLASRQGGGSLLPDDVRSFMEPRFGFDFSQVRIHADSDAVQMNQELGAQAFTHRNDIYFNSGKYNPGSSSGQELLAHELTHTVQQTGGKTLGNTNRSPSEKGIQQGELIQAKAISKAPFPLISLKAIPDGGIVGPATPPPAPQLDTTNSESLLQSLSTTPASSLSQAVNQAKGATGQIHAQEKQELETNLPEQESSTGLPRRSSRPQVKATALEPGEAPTLKMANGRAKKEFKVKHEAAQGTVPGSNVSTEASSSKGSGGWLDWLTGRVSNFLKDLPTKDPGLNTSAGDRPKVDLDGEANPDQNDQFQRESEKEIKARKLKAEQAAAEDFGENDIYPTVAIQRLHSSHQLSSPQSLEGRGKNPPNLPEDTRASFDQYETQKLSPKLQHQLRSYQAKEAKHQRESQQIRQEGQNRIDQETQRVRDQQTGLQQQAQGNVNAERQRWREENERIQEEYNDKSQAKRRDLDRQIQDQVETTERETDRKLTEAEQRSEAEQRKTEREAEDKKRDFENKPKNFWERAKDSISSFFEGLRQSIESLFEGLRQLVRQIIEAAKTAVRTLIEAARRVIVGLIRGFGEVLKGLVTVALFAFPDTAARAREWIDGKVNTAVEWVNEAAERLTQFTDAALDWIGERLDQALNLLQGAFNVALDVAEFLATAPLEIMNQLAQIMDWLQENGGLIGGIQKLEQSAAEVETAAKEKLQGYVDQIPDEMQRLIDEAQQEVDSEAIKKHLEGIWHYLKQDFENLKNGWWGAVKEMLWTWIWPFNENSPVQQDWPKFTQELGNCLNHVRAGEYSKAIDSFLKASQLLAGIVDAFSAWFTLAAVIIGAVIGAFFFGVGAIAGAKVGLEVAGAFGTVLSVFSIAVEAGILGKSIYDLASGKNTAEEDDKDYQDIASSGMALATEAVFAILGAAIGAAAGSSIGIKIGHSIASAIVRMLRKLPRIPRPRHIPDLPNGRPDLDGSGRDGTDGVDADGTGDGDTSETPGATEPDTPTPSGRSPEEPGTTEPDTDGSTQTPDEPRDQSTGDGTEPTTPDTTHPTGDSSQSPETDTRPGNEPSTETNTPRSDGRLTEDQLAEGLPPDLQGQVPVRINPELPGNTVRVHYTRNSNGTVGDIHIEAGPDARKVDIELHAETVRLMQRYSGLSGRVRLLKERIENWIRRNGEPPVGSRAWEAKLEIEKLPRIIDERLQRLSKGDLDAEAEADLRADIENLEQQLARHQQTLDDMDTDPGVGFVAANDRADSPDSNGRDSSNAEDAHASQADNYDELTGKTGGEPIIGRPPPAPPPNGYRYEFDHSFSPPRVTRIIRLEADDSRFAPLTIDSEGNVALKGGGPTPGGNPVNGSTPANRLGTRMHTRRARARETGGWLVDETRQGRIYDLELDDEFDVVDSSITDSDGHPIQVPKRVDPETGTPRSGTRDDYQPEPDAVRFGEGKIIDDKPIGRPLAKDRQEIIRFIEAFVEREGRLPEAIEIHRYDPDTGLTVEIEVYPPEDFVPWRFRTTNSRTPTVGGQTQANPSSVQEHSSFTEHSPRAQQEGEQSTSAELSPRGQSQVTNSSVQERNRPLEYESQQSNRFHNGEPERAPQGGQREPEQSPENRSGQTEHALEEPESRSEELTRLESEQPTFRDIPGQGERRRIAIYRNDTFEINSGHAYREHRTGPDTHPMRVGTMDEVETGIMEHVQQLRANGQTIPELGGRTGNRPLTERVVINGITIEYRVGIVNGTFRISDYWALS